MLNVTEHLNCSSVFNECGSKKADSLTETSGNKTGFAVKYRKEILTLRIPFPARRGYTRDFEEYGSITGSLLKSSFSEDEHLEMIENFRSKMLVHTRFFIGNLRVNGKKSHTLYPDHDNFPALKATQDAVCSWLMRDDNIVTTSNYYDGKMLNTLRSESYIEIYFVPYHLTDEYMMPLFLD